LTPPTKVRGLTPISSEMADHQRLTPATDIDAFFASHKVHDNAVGARTTNGLLRQYFPKGTDLAVHSQARLNAVTTQPNERPKKTLDFETPAERFNQCVASIG